MDEKITAPFVDKGAFISRAKKEPITCLYTLRHWILVEFEIRLRLVKARME